jgi:two-component system, OmpR family, sensor kinase
MSEGRRTLFRRIYLHGLMLLVLVVLALAVAGFLLGRDHRFHASSPRLAHHVGGLLEAVPDQALPSLVAQLADDLDVNLAVYREDGTRLAAGGPRPPPPLPVGETRAARGHPRGPFGRHFVAQGPAGPGRYLRLTSERFAGDFLLRALVGPIALIILVVALVSAPLARAISRPIEELGRVARRLGEGDLTARAGFVQRDEIGALGRTFDEMAERLERLLKGHRELLAGVSHELRTPLARIRVSLDLAAEAPQAEVQRHLAAIEADVAELEALVGDLLTTSRLDAGGGLVLRREPIEPRDLVEQAIGRLSRLHPGREVKVTFEPVSDFQGEPGLLARVLDNLLDNAARYSEPGSPIEVEVRPAEGGLQLTVRDHGIGISSEDQARIFTPFFRADPSRARHTGGVGLGLALSKQIVQAHGGRIDLTSVPNAGTTVRVWLPVSATS